MSKSKFPQSYHDFEKSNGGTFVEFNREPSLTRQEFAEECDINVLMSRMNGHVIGGPGNLPPREPMYFDFADLPQDLLGYMNFMQDAERQFMMMPAVVRKEFENDPIQFVEYASDPANIDQMRSWGLAAPAKPPEAPPAAPSSQPPADASKPPAPVSGAPTHGST